MPPHVSFLKELSGDLEPTKLQQKFLGLLLNLQNVERGSIWIRKGGFYQCIEAAGSQSDQIRGLKLQVKDKSIVGWVIERGEMTIAEAGVDARHHKQTEDMVNVKSKLILCFPLFLTNGEVYGAVQVIDTSAGGRRLNLSPDYLKLIHDMVDIGSIALSNALIRSRQIEQVRTLQKTIDHMYSGKYLVGVSPGFTKTMELVENYARTDYPVLIYGESGTGKELIAKEIHRRSARRHMPLLVQNVSAIPDTLLESEMFGYEKGAFTGAEGRKMGLFEAADGGTVFLDELGEMDLGLQAKLLRVLEDNEVKPLGANKGKRVNVRVLSATNRDLEKSIAEGSFREDLFYRLNVLPLRIPPLRERKEDIPFLVGHFFKREAKYMNQPLKRMNRAALEAVMNYHWPGNIRELENFIRQLMVLCANEIIGVENIPAYIRQDAFEHEAPFDGGVDAEVAAACRNTPMSPVLNMEGLTWEEVERRYASYLLAAHGGNVSRAAKVANVNRSTFASRLAKLGVNKTEA